MIYMLSIPEKKASGVSFPFHTPVSLIVFEFYIFSNRGPDAHQPGSRGMDLESISTHLHFRVQLKACLNAVRGHLHSQKPSVVG